MASDKYKTVYDESFVNPYNFVTVDLRKTDRKNIRKDNEKLLNGYLNCRLKTVTPLAIPETDTVEGKGHKTYSFYRLPGSGVPAIPGSSLRGMIRSVYETVTDSCFVTSRPDDFVTKRAGMGEAAKSFLLVFENGKWHLHKAERYLFIIDDPDYAPFNKPEYKDAFRITKKELLKEYAYGEKVYFSSYKSYVKKSPQGSSQTVGNLIRSFSKDKTPDNQREGYLYIGEVPPSKNGRLQSRKHFESIFVDTGEDYGEVYDDEIESIRTIYDCYNDSAVNQNLSDRYPFYYRGVKKLIDNKQKLPIWYNEKTYKFSLAAMGRIVFDSAMGDLIEDKKLCESRDSLCKACSLFGTSKGEGVGSRIRITDAILTGNDEYKGEMTTLKELAGPKISFVPFYADVKDKKFNLTYDDPEIKIRGRKYYWHHKLDENGNLKPEDYQTDQKTDRNSTMELVDKDNFFEFRVYFDGITEEELKELKWVLSLGENSFDSRMCHKIGHGKPLGLGSVKIVIEQENIRQTNPYKIDSLSGLEKTSVDLPFAENSTLKDLKMILNMESVNGFEQITYPYVVDSKPGDNKTAAHQWFNIVNDRKDGLQQKMETIEKTVEQKKYLNPIRFNDYSSPDNRRYRAPDSNPQPVSNNNPVMKVTVTGISKKGNVFFEDGKGGGFVPFSKLRGNIFNKGETINVRFVKEKTFEDGNTTREYELT